MKPGREALVVTLLLAAVIAGNATWLSPELFISSVNLNDNAFHFALKGGIMTRGGHPANLASVIKEF